MLQLCIDWIDLIKHKLVHPQAQNNCMPSQTCVSKSESVVVRWVEMIVCDEWMWCGVDVVCAQSARGGRDYAGCGKDAVSAV